jgi:hypothetical protein
MHSNTSALSPTNKWGWRSRTGRLLFGYAMCLLPKKMILKYLDVVKIDV